MKDARNSARPLASLKRQAAARLKAVRVGKGASDALRFALALMLLLPGLIMSPVSVGATDAKAAAAKAPAQTPPQRGAMATPAQEAGQTYQPTKSPVKAAGQVNVRQAAAQEALAPQEATPDEIRAIDAPKTLPDSWFENRGIPNPDGVGGDDLGTMDMPDQGPQPQAPPASGQGPSPGPTTTFQAEMLNGTSIPPDTMGAVGTNHVVSVSNTHVSVRTREGILLSRVTLNAFWAGVVLEGGATPSTFDPKIFYDRFNDKYFFFTSANAQSPASAVLFAVTNTNDPTGTWTRYVFDADPAATGGPNGTGRWADYPTIGFNKNHIVANYNVFVYTCNAAGTSCPTTAYYGPYIYVIDKPAAYANTLSTVSLFQANSATCASVTDLACGFTMAPAVVEDNTTEIDYLVEDWDSIAGQLRVSKITGTPTAPVLTVGTQFPQSPFSWRFNAARIATSGGYVPQRDQLTYAAFSQRIMANDSRINNSVQRNGSLWASHHVMVAATPTAAGTGFNTTNPDIRTAVQWWEINPTIEDNVFSTPPIQRARIEDPTADNCNSGNSSSVSTVRAGCTQQVGQFFTFAGISVNKNNDVLIGFSQFSPLTYPSAAYAIRRAADPPNTTRDVVVYRPGQAAYNIGAGAGNTTARQNRWGDYSASQTDPLNDTDFWTVQEYAGTRRDLNGAGFNATPWETWWARVSPTATQPSNTGNLIISEFRVRGPQGVRDEFIELYNPSDTPMRVVSVDNSEGWALATNNGVTTTGVTVVPQGTVVPARGHFLIANNPDFGAGGLPTQTYSLNGYGGKTPNTVPANEQVRLATSDTGYSIDLADNTGVALFKSSNALTGFIPANQSDAAGFSGAGTLFREGLGIPALVGAFDDQHSFWRRLPGGCTGSGGGASGNCTTPTAIGSTPGPSSSHPQDSNDNAADFLYVNTYDLGGSGDRGAGVRLGAPGPENLDSPLNRDQSLQIQASFPAPCVASSAPPNRVRDLTAVTNGTFGTIKIRRNYTNNTGVPVTRLRLRVVDISTFPAIAGVADLRALSSSDVVITNPCTGLNLNARGLTLETPPTQTNGGGFNSSLSAGFITLSSPLSPVAGSNTITVEVNLGVQQNGKFRIFLNLEALP